MKYTAILLFALLLINCKHENNNNEADEVIKETEINEPYLLDSMQKPEFDLKHITNGISIGIKQKALIEKKDERDGLKQLIIDKSYVWNAKDFVINFKYPLLNETLQPKNKNFNDFMNSYYVNVSKTIADIRESKLLCDSIAAENFREERFIDYKIYGVNDQLVSVFFYKENFYSGAMHPSYSFDCFNFNIKKGVFMTYEDFFIQGSEDELLSIMNKKITNKISKGDIYYDCWEVSSTDFFESKNNFVLNDTYLEFYFDDCVMCPSYTGTYSIELPLTDLLSVLKKYDTNPLVF